MTTGRARSNALETPASRAAAELSPSSWRTASALVIAALGVGLLGCGPVDDVGTGEDFASEGPPLAYEEYQVLFTNPVCDLYEYGPDQEVYSVAGERLLAKPKDAFCTKADAEASGARPESPQHKMVEWIQDPSTEHVFFAALSFSNSVIQEELCRAVTERSVKVEFVMDRDSDLTKANRLLACQPASGDPADAPELHLRGKEGNISLHHNKLFLFNPYSDRVRIAFGSGNVSSGLVLHHENWHFVTVPSSTHFAQAHQCMREGLIEHGHSKGDYSEYVNACRASIEPKEESDMKTFFVPGDGGSGTNTIIKAIDRAEAIDIAAHRYTHSTHVKRIRRRFENPNPPALRFVGDDDLYWAGQGEIVGGNEPFEYDHVQSLVALGMQERYVETNHGAHLLHHNKVYIFTMPEEQPSGVFCGAGNFTKSAFRDNYENFYYVTIPHVVEAFRAQYDHLFNTLATEPPNLPAQNVLPPQG
ncbi:MAG: hypothetical protein JRI23_31460 [Deltaproteobacteria bacterium]|nr:hypothetical protein [Deltaproteobacteria bacterium]MBW2536734.1 hypothetical protein [Deltaproteobacteria bacterium]